MVLGRSAEAGKAAPFGTLREAHKAVTRELIRNAAKELFMSNSVNSVTMDQIASEAGVSRPTIYTHYKDKDEIIGDIVDVYTRLANEINKRIPSPDPSISEIRIWLDEKVTLYRREGVSLSLLHQAGHGDPKGRLRVAHKSMADTLDTLAERLPVLRLALLPGNHQPHARVRAEMLVRQITAACDLCAREGATEANKAALDVTAELFRELLDRYVELGA